MRGIKTDGYVSIRGGSGLGDALYLQSVARHLVAQGHHVEACTAWGDPFLPLIGRVKISPFRRTEIDRLAHYASRRGISGTSQWQDVCQTAQIPIDTPLRLDWTVGGTVARRIKAMAGARPVVLVQMPRAPFARKDGYGIELLPDCSVIQRAIDFLSPFGFVVQIGAGIPLYRYARLGFDAANQTSVRDLIDLATLADGFLGFVSFIVPLAESLDKPGLLIWARRGLVSKHEPVRQITPIKVLHRKELFSVVFDDCLDNDLRLSIETFCGSIGCRAAA